MATVHVLLITVSFLLNKVAQGQQQQQQHWSHL